MAQINLNVPTLVQRVEVDQKSSFYLRPLFVRYPVATHRRFELAVNQFQKEIKRTFKGFILSRINMENLLWFMFQPELHYELKHFNFKFGKQFVDGVFNVVRFDLQGHTFICLPSINDYMFIAKQNAPQKALDNQTKEVIQMLFRKLKEELGKEFSVETYYSSEKEFVTPIKVSINITYGGFKFDNQMQDWFFSRMGAEHEFIGALEVEKVGYDLNGRYPSQLRRAYYQEELVGYLYKIIFQKENIPIAIIGREGVGKHTLVQEAIWRYESSFYEKKSNPSQRLWHIDPTRVIAGMSIVGMWQKRFEAILSFIKQPYEKHSKRSDKILIDNVVAMLRIGRSAQNDMTLSDVLKPYLEKRQLQIVVIASPEEWKILQEQDRRFSDLFQVIRLQEPEPELAVKIVLQQRKALELENDCEITVQAIEQLFAIQRNYMKNKALPGAVMKLLTQLAVKYKFQEIDVPEVREEFENFSGLKERIFDSTHTFEKEEVKKLIEQELVGQPDAVAALANVVHTVKARLTDKSKPLGSFMFIGPTGVGKTQAAKILCNYLLGKEDFLMRFDMNEYIGPTAVQRLIGDYYNPEGQLTGKVRYRPFGVVLLDEIEKAHPKVHDLLLQVLDDGRLTDSLGRTVDFTNTIIIMTSNVGARNINQQLSIGTQNRNDKAIYRKALENKFRPEFLNRIDSIVIFNHLQLKHILNIARLLIKELLKRDGFVRRTTILNISKDALEWVAKRGFDKKMGGRALKRQIEKDLTALSAEQLISSYSDNPIIFDILYEKGRLVPKITNLDFVTPLQEGWLPHLPEVSKGRAFYRKLLRTVERLEDRILDYEYEMNYDDNDMISFGGEQNQNLNWQYYDFKDKVAEIKEQITTIMLGFSERYFKDPPAIPLRLKTGYLYQRRSVTKAVRENIRDRLFQQEALKEISEAYHHAATQWDSMKTEFIDNFLNVAFLKLFARGFLDNEPQKAYLRLYSCIVGMGEAEVKFLAELYVAFFKEMDIAHTLAKDYSHIIIEGHAFADLLAGEIGIHLFYQSHQNPLPIRVELELNNSNVVKEVKVIRIYDKDNTLTDLRTGFTNAVNITAEEFKLLVYAGIDKVIRMETLRVDRFRFKS